MKMRGKITKEDKNIKFKIMERIYNQYLEVILANRAGEEENKED